MAYQSIWYYTDLPEDIVDIIERDLTENFDQQMGDSKLHGDALNKKSVIRRMHGFLLITGLVVFCGTISNVLIARTFFMICEILMGSPCNIPGIKKAVLWVA